MNRMRILAGVLVVGVAILATSTLVTAQPEATADASVARGRYLVTIMACNECHSPGSFYVTTDSSRFLAGSEMGWAGPWGIAYAANLTPDSLTGLAKWKLEDIANAIRTGNRPDGRQLTTAMPWLNYSHLTDGDALAIARYLKTLKPVKHAVPPPLKPGEDVTGSVLGFPPPSAWDAPRDARAGAKK